MSNHPTSVCSVSWTSDVSFYNKAYVWKSKIHSVEQATGQSGQLLPYIHECRAQKYKNKLPVSLTDLFANTWTVKVDRYILVSPVLLRQTALNLMYNMH